MGLIQVELSTVETSKGLMIVVDTLLKRWQICVKIICTRAHAHIHTYILFLTPEYCVICMYIIKYSLMHCCHLLSAFRSISIFLQLKLDVDTYMHSTFLEARILICVSLQI